MALTINLPEHITAYIRRQVEEGRFTSEEAVIADAVEQVMDEYRWEDDEDLLEAIAEADRGEVTPWSDDLLGRLADEARENSRRGHQVSDDIKY